VSARRGGPRGITLPRGAPRTAFSPARLLAEAEIARTHAYAPYSRFMVGAALLTREGRVIHGCNVENASFGLSICAERNAIWKAIGEGERDFVAVAVTAGRDGGASPCGACRQVLHEFAPGLVVYWRDPRGRIARAKLARLLQQPFKYPGRKAR
jgi:cytidine deaminase